MGCDPRGHEGGCAARPGFQRPQWTRSRRTGPRLRPDPARAFYAQPNFANPTGAQWSSSTGDRVLDVVRDAGAFVIEDDWAHDFGISTESVPLFARDDSGHVVYVRSLTKSVAPSVRVAAIVARGPARERILADAQAESVYVSGVLQMVALDVVTQPAWQTHLRAVRRELESRRNLLASELRELAPDVDVDGLPPGGLNLWGRLPDDVDAETVARDCEQPGCSSQRVANGSQRSPPASTSVSTSPARTRRPSGRPPGSSDGLSPAGEDGRRHRLVRRRWALLTRVRSSSVSPPQIPYRSPESRAY